MAALTVPKVAAAWVVARSPTHCVPASTAWAAAAAVVAVANVRAVVVDMVAAAVAADVVALVVVVGGAVNAAPHVPRAAATKPASLPAVAG